MVWFKVDDKLADHRKVRRLGKDKLPAMGLWVLCGSWVGGETHDGFVPEEIIQRFDPTLRYARRLVAVGLWEEAPDSGDEPGLAFHQWDEHQPTAQQVAAKRQADAERRARWRQGKRASSDGVSRQESRRDADRDADRDLNPDSVTERSTPASNPSHDHHEQGLMIDSPPADSAAPRNGADRRSETVGAGQEGVSRRDSRRDTSRESRRESQGESRPGSRLPDPTRPISLSSSSSTSRKCLAEAGIDDEIEIDKILELIRAENPQIRNESAYVARLIANGDLTETRRRAALPTSAPRTAVAEAYVNDNRHAFQTLEDPPLSDSACTQCPLPPSHDIHRSARTAPGGDAA